MVAFGQDSNWWLLHRADSTRIRSGRTSKVIEPLDDGNFWQRAAHNHLLDFSDTDRTQNLIVVDPVVQAYVGSIRTVDADGNPKREVGGTTSVGHVFKASLTASGTWEGELFGARSLAEPLLGFWATDYRIPGWGRAKLGKDGGYNTVDEAYFDVMFTRGG